LECILPFKKGNTALKVDLDTTKKKGRDLE
jgi:hypothetical protein